MSQAERIRQADCSPGRQAGTARERMEATRIRLLEAAEAVFGEKGFFRASVSDITRRAGVAQGTFYTHFAAKEDAFRELVRQMSHDLRRELQEAVASLGDRRDAERVGLQVFLPSPGSGGLFPDGRRADGGHAVDAMGREPAATGGCRQRSLLHSPRA